MIYIETEIGQIDLGEALGMVSEQRRQYALSYSSEHDQRLSLAAYLLLQRALKAEYGIIEQPIFSYGEHGKPMLVGHSDIFFSLSHCRDAVACVIASDPVGIDIESLSRYKERVAARVMNDDEQRHIASSSEPSLAFMRLWTMKESLLKMTGEGITTDLRKVLSVNAEKCRFETMVYSNFVCSVCFSVAHKSNFFG